MSTFNIAWKILYVGQHAINGGFGATMEFSFLDTVYVPFFFTMISWVTSFCRTQLTIKGQHIPTLKLDMDQECQGCQVRIHTSLLFAC